MAAMAGLELLDGPGAVGLRQQVEEALLSPEVLDEHEPVIEVVGQRRIELLTSHGVEAEVPCCRQEVRRLFLGPDAIEGLPRSGAPLGVQTRGHVHVHIWADATRHGSGDALLDVLERDDIEVDVDAGMLRHVLLGEVLDERAVLGDVLVALDAVQ